MYSLHLLFTPLHSRGFVYILINTKYNYYIYIIIIG